MSVERTSILNMSLITADGLLQRNRQTIEEKEDGKNVAR